MIYTLTDRSTCLGDWFVAVGNADMSNKMALYKYVMDHEVFVWHLFTNVTIQVKACFNGEPYDIQDTRIAVQCAPSFHAKA
jgi:hypothetical protein